MKFLDDFQVTVTFKSQQMKFEREKEQSCRKYFEKFRYLLKEGVARTDHEKYLWNVSSQAIGPIVIAMPL